MYNALIIEDDVTVRSYLKRIIQKKFPFNISEAENGSVGLEKMKNVKPDIIFLDISMPVMSGIEFLEHIKLDSEYSKIPVLVLTAHNDRGTIQKILQLGVSDYILKPIDPAKTFDRIQQLLDNLEK
jgi:two-component system response regulator DctR